MDGYSAPTILGSIVKLAQSIQSDSRWLEYYAHETPTEQQTADIECCVADLKDALNEVGRWVDVLKGTEM